MDKKVKKLIIISIVAFLALLTCYKSCDIVSPNERGVTVKLGQVQGDTIKPGMIWHAPFITGIRTFKLEPKTYEVSFSVGTDGAITKDMQTVGATVAIRYMYDENRIVDIVTKYANDSIIENAMKDNVKASLKETTGKYSIYDLVQEQNAITKEVADAMLIRMQDYPIKISQTTITNWDWDDSFDRMIRETANRKQQVLQAEQEANIAAAQAQKLVKEAEAKKQAAQLDAEAQIAKAKGEAEAKKVKADAQAYENQKIAQNLSVMKAQWDYEVAKIRAEKFNGVEVSNQSVYVPNTYDLKAGK